MLGTVCGARGGAGSDGHASKQQSDGGVWYKQLLSPPGSVVSVRGAIGEAPLKSEDDKLSLVSGKWRVASGWLVPAGMMA